jgi:hypothetical protein
LAARIVGIMRVLQELEENATAILRPDNVVKALEAVIDL